MRFPVHSPPAQAEEEEEDSESEESVEECSPRVQSRGRRGEGVVMTLNIKWVAVFFEQPTNHFIFKVIKNENKTTIKQQQ